MKQYLDLAEEILKKGSDVETRNGKVRRLFARQLVFDLLWGEFPAITTKRIAFSVVVGELLWFIEGGKRTGYRMDNNRLREILGYGPGQRTIWSEDCGSSRWKPKAKFPGDCGRIYGAQWRDWPVYVEAGEEFWGEKKFHRASIDQLATAIRSIREDPWDRQSKVVTARNPAEMDDMCLPACHERFQLFVTPGISGNAELLSLHMTQRSCDFFLGVPFNIASYALLLCMVAQVTGLKPSQLIIDFMDVHVYHIHFKQMARQIERNPLPAPRLWLNPEVKDIDSFTKADIRLENYMSHEPIKADLAKDKTDLAKI